MLMDDRFQYLNVIEKQAAQLQEMTRRSESAKAEDFDEASVRRAVVYTREDMVLLVSHLSSVNKQLSFLKTMLVLILIAIVSGLVWK